MDKRVLLTVAVSMAILLGWTVIQKQLMPPPLPPEAATPSTPAKGPGEKPSAPAPAQPGAPAGQPAPPTPEVPEVVNHVEQPDYWRAAFTSRGAAPSSWVLLSKQYQEQGVQKDGKQELRPIDLVKTRGKDLPLAVTFPQSDFTLAEDAVWTPLPSEPNQLNYAWDNQQVYVEKRFTFVPGSYEIHLKVIVENRSDKPVSEHLQLHMAGWQDPNVKPSGMFSQRLVQTEGMCDVGGKLKNRDLEGLLKEPIEAVGQVRWIGVDEKYFVQAVAVQVTPEDKRCRVGATPDGTIRATLLLSEKKLQPKEKAEVSFAGFFGPKILNKLDDVKVGGVDAKLGDAINYGWTEAIARPMLAVLKAVHVVVPNWGVAVIALTILLKALTWWPTQKSMKSMRAMAKLKPEIDKLKAKCGDDKQKFNMATMALYKERGINPLGGCLPMLIQMPIYIALYSMLGSSVELYRSAFVGWIDDLTSPDAYYLLPILTGILMFAQQKMSPTPPDGQQKAMMYMMPVMFTAFSIFLPAGLTIYILTNTLLTMLQQWWMNRGEGPMGKPAPARPVKA